MATMTQQVYQSKWGYHPCSRETYRKLRFLNGVYQKALSMAEAYRRWERKAPHNRILKETVRDEQGIKRGKRPIVDAAGKPVPQPEPEICPVFSNKVVRKVNYDRDGSYSPNGVERTFVETDGPYILAASRQARKPVATPEEVRPLPISEEDIDKLYAQAKDWVESR